METYPYELLIRGKPGGQFDTKGSHFITSDLVNGRDHLRDAVPIQAADVGPWLNANFTGMVAQIAGLEVERDAALAETAEAETALAERNGVIAGLQAQIAELTAPPAYITISDRQFFQALALNDLITQDEAEAAVATGTIPAAMAALVEQLPAEQQFGARMLLKGATAFRSDHPLTDALAALYAWSPEQKLALFQAASQL